MSHFAILPTVMRDADLLVSALESLKLSPQRGGSVGGFAGELHPVAVQIQLREGPTIGWRHQPDGTLALVADLQALCRSNRLSPLLKDINHRYAVHLALQQASTHLSAAVVDLVC